MFTGFFSFLNFLMPQPATPPSVEGRVLVGTRYPWNATIEGEDIVVIGQSATWFGGAEDPDDDGQTASGISTKANPDFFGCALPMDLKPLVHNPCSGSPLPLIPWFNPVLVTNRDNEKAVTVKLIDLGPSAPPAATAAIDLTVAAFVALGGKIAIGRIPVNYRILGGAKYIKGGLRS